MKKKRLTKEDKLEIDKEIRLLAEDKLEQNKKGRLEAYLWAAAYTGRWYTMLSADFLDSNQIERARKCSLIALHCHRVYNKLHNKWRHKQDKIDWDAIDWDANEPQ